MGAILQRKASRPRPIFPYQMAEYRINCNKPFQGRQAGFSIIFMGIRMSTCSRCGAAFECGMVEALETPCWCTALPALPADSLPDAADDRCLCPVCLKTWMARLETAAAAGGEAGGA